MLIRTSTSIIYTLLSIACICHRPLHLESSQTIYPFISASRTSCHPSISTYTQASHSPYKSLRTVVFAN
ncbi:hypothetical protein I7I53_10071 [Histoplasma capsulatum var. duboisii H88]|uniref:Uncharacterized protein n=1 Tax=Ajellomyces capsulatus (strain H88) TaxID=544711 RepID=A0A8A1L6T9_AJEC8|nr:hypothetical protein I7I53_10071 [Histoplasma capsulatum var. duboisii H88]